MAARRHFNASLPPALWLPPEIWSLVTIYLPNCDLKSLRLTSRFLGGAVSVRLHRVFLSPNPRNIEVFRAVADHNDLRLRIVEIIYDDARLARSAAEAGIASDTGHNFGTDFPAPSAEDHEWFQSAREENISLLEKRSRRNRDHPANIARQCQEDAEMSLEEVWAYYQDLVRQQDRILESGADIETLLYGLRRFPFLRRVTITPAAHGFIFTPLYETPMIRAFPTGFNYPLPRGWPCPQPGREIVAMDALPWVGIAPGTNTHADTVKAQWRGYRAVTRLLAEQEHKVSELNIDACYLATGLNYRIFEHRSDDYDNFASIIRRPGFSYIHLSLLVGGEQEHNYPSFRSGLLRDALSQAAGLKTFALSTDYQQREYIGGNSELPPLRNIFPVDRWPKLEHFGLWNFLIKKDDLVNFLSALPPTLRSVELGVLSFFHGHGDYRELLFDMRNMLDWKSRDIQPTVTIARTLRDLKLAGRAHWLNKEVDEFLYSQGPNPFGFMNGHLPNDVLSAIGRIQDVYDPSYNRPYS